MRALVLEGGAMRGIFTAGVLDALTEQGHEPFDIILGVSAGACCAASFLSEQEGRNKRIFVDYLSTKNFADPKRALRLGSLVDMDYLMGPVTQQLDPLDVESLRRHRTRLWTVAADAHTGKPAYLPAQDEDCLAAIHCTVALPVFYRQSPITFRQGQYFDGGIVDPIPIGRAYEMGATEVMAVLTRPSSWYPKDISLLSQLVIGLDLRRFPAAVDNLKNRPKAYARARALLAAPPRGVQVRVIRPPEGFPVARFTQDKKTLLEGYDMGKRALDAN